MNRRSFLKTLGATIAVGFARVETAVLDRPGPLVNAALAAAEPGYIDALTFHGIPMYADDATYRNCYMGISRETIALFEGASGDPTADK